MESLTIFENQLNEFSAKECHPLGYRLVDYLPTEWEHIESGVQKHGVNIKFEMSPDLEKLSNEELVAHTLSKHFERTSDGKFRIKGGGRFVNLREVAFQNLLCDFYMVCNKNQHHYTETNFIHVMEINGFHIPQYIYRAYDMYKKTEISTVCFMPSNLYNVKDILDDIKESPVIFARQYQCKNSLDYYIAVALELIRQKKFVKQCEHCGRWFVAKKADEKYCTRKSPYSDNQTCKERMRNIKSTERINNDKLKKAKERARNRANSREIYHPGAKDEYRRLVSEWDMQYKSGRISEDEYIERLDSCMMVKKRGEKA